MAHDNDDADAIRARRAILISTTLAALSCGGPGDGAVPSTTTSEPVTSTSVSARPSATAFVGAPLRPWATVLEQAPPRGVPAAAKGADRAQLEALEAAIDRRYATMRAAWEAVPACDAADSACRSTWREVAEKAKAVFAEARGRGFGGCGDAHGETGSLVGRRAAHELYLQKLTTELEAHLTTTADGFSAQGGQEWQRLLANAKKPPPMPCLSPCPMPQVATLLQTIGFDEGASTVRDDDATLKSIVTIYKGNPKPSKIIVRGHADAKEAKPTELAAARAAAVAAWLIKAGVPKDRVETQSFDASLPVRRSDTKEEAALNRRVDFEAVPL